MSSSKMRLCWVAIGMLCASVAMAALKEGDALPALRAGQFEGKVPELAGKVVLLDFWASWCGPCKKSFPELEKLYDAYRERGFVLLAVSVDENAAAMQEFLKRHVVSFPVVRDKDQVLVGAAGIDSMPTSFLIDRSGKIRSIHNGFHGEKTVEALKREIEELLSEERP